MNPGFTRQESVGSEVWRRAGMNPGFTRQESVESEVHMEKSWNEPWVYSTGICRE